MRSIVILIASEVVAWNRILPRIIFWSSQVRLPLLVLCPAGTQFIFRSDALKSVQSVALHICSEDGHRYSRYRLFYAHFSDDVNIRDFVHDFSSRDTCIRKPRLHVFPRRFPVKFLHRLARAAIHIF